MNIVISRAPLRISFVGGGSDLSGGEGQTVSCSVDKYVYCVIKRRYDSRVYVTWREKENHDDVIHVRHSLIRESLLRVGIRNGVEVLTFADVPGVGSGLGSSAATTVATLKAAYELTGHKNTSSEFIADVASGVELVKLKRCGGRQDQYTSAIGGLLHLHHDDGKISSITKLDSSFLKLLSDYFLLFSPGKSTDGRNSDEILRGFQSTPKFRNDCIDLCSKFVKTYNDKSSFSRLGRYVHEHHLLKLTAFPGGQDGTIPYMDEGNHRDFDKASPTWKLCGAGSTGHLLVGCKPENRIETIEDFNLLWGPQLPFEFTDKGVEVVYSE